MTNYILVLRISFIIMNLWLRRALVKALEIYAQLEYDLFISF